MQELVLTHATKHFVRMKCRSCIDKIVHPIIVYTRKMTINDMTFAYNQQLAILLNLLLLPEGCNENYVKPPF
jgi:hypothetical protein